MGTLVLISERALEMRGLAVSIATAVDFCEAGPSNRDNEFSLCTDASANNPVLALEGTLNGCIAV